MKRARERVDLFEPKQKRDLSRAEVRAREQLPCRSSSNIIEEVLVRRAQLAEAALHGAWAHAEGLGDRRDGWTVSAHRFAQGGADIVGQRLFVDLLGNR
jgi:hypothetical protein